MRKRSLGPNRKGKQSLSCISIRLIPRTRRRRFQFPRSLLNRRPISRKGQRRSALAVSPSTPLRTVSALPVGVSYPLRNNLTMRSLFVLLHRISVFSKRLATLFTQTALRIDRRTRSKFRRWTYFPMQLRSFPSQMHLSAILALPIPCIPFRNRRPIPYLPLCSILPPLQIQG